MAEQAQSVEPQMQFNAETALERLREYRKRDPHFQLAIADFVEGEVTNADPVEGVPLKEEASQPGPVQSKIREMLGA